MKRYKSVFNESNQPEGLMVIGRTQRDNYKIGELVNAGEYYAEWDAREGFWFFPEDEGMYDTLEMQLTDEFNKLKITASFEGVF